MNYKHFWNLLKTSMAPKCKDGKFVYGEKTNLNAIKALCFFLAYDPRFVTELKLDPNKGLMFIGDTGTGKSIMIESVSNNEYRPIKILNMKDIEASVKETGVFDDFLFRRGWLLCIDDVGTEETPIDYFGTKINWFSDFIKKEDVKGRCDRVILTQNLNMEEVSAKYGARTASRIYQNFNIVVIKAEEDFRKKNRNVLK